MRKFKGTIPDAPDTTSIKHPALKLTVRTPQCGHTVWGIYTYIYIYMYIDLFLYIYIYIHNTNIIKSIYIYMYVYNII